MYLVTIIYYILSFLNSHFGSSYSSEESDDKNDKPQNIISKIYHTSLNYIQIYSPFTKYTHPSQIPSIHIDDLTKESFLKYSHNFTKPVIIKGFLKDCEATQKWDLDFFKNNYGDTLLPILKTKTKYSFQVDRQNITMKEFIKSIENDETLYLNNVSRIFGNHPELLKHLDLENIEKYTGVDVVNSTNVTHMFMGGKDTGTTLHCSITGNFFYNIKGKKKWYLINPEYSPYLKPITSKTGLFAVSLYDICNANKNDYILNIPRYEFVLEPGDMLYNPPWWWHAVINKSDYTIGCANRFTDFLVSFKNNPGFSSLFFSHPISNYTQYNTAKTKTEANKTFDKYLIGDILELKDIDFNKNGSL